MKRVDLTDQRIGTITVLGPEGVNKDGRSLWRCKCDCGNEYITTSGVLRTARTCKRCASTKKIEGVRFGKLVALTHMYDEKGRHCWICRCDCGNEIVYQQRYLLNGHATTCKKCPVNTFTRSNGVGIGKTASGDSFLFDEDDWERVTTRNWHKTQKGYIVSDHRKKLVILHRFIMNAPNNTQVDHINRIKTDCRKENLRFATNALNCANTGVYESNLSTGHKNVYAVDGRYRVTIRKNNKLKHFGYYDDIAIAINVANEKRRELFGEFAFFDDTYDQQKAFGK